MKLKIFLIGFFCLIPFFQAKAYPWIFRDGLKKTWSFELDAQTRYLLKNVNSSFLKADVKIYHPTLDMNLGWTYSFVEQKSYFRPSELSLVFPVTKKWKLNIGFKNVLWSEADRYWDYGLWQPRFLLDVFRPEQIGIPGVYFDYQGKGSLIFLISYFYLPDVLIRPQIKKGTLVSKNPFFIQSFDSFRWNLESLKDFKIKNFFKPSIAFQMKHFIKRSNVSFSYAYKPVNQLQYTGLFKGLNLSGNHKEKFVIQDFKYSLVSHHLVNVEANTVFNKNFSLYMGLIYENPEKDFYESKWISDGFESQVTFSVMSYFQSIFEEDMKALFSFGWTKTIENKSNNKNSNILTEDLESLFGRGFNWKHALSFSMEYHNQNILKGLLFRFRANYTLDNYFYVLAMENYFHLTSSIQAYFLGDVLFSFFDSKTKKQASNIQKYEKHSRLSLGVKYVF